MYLRVPVVVGSLFLLTATVGAVVPRTPGRVASDALTAMPSASLAKPLRAQRDVKWAHAPSPAWNKLAATGRWQAAWDRATGVPNRIWGSGLAAPGATASADVAAAFARAALADHIALLAPGSTPADFELVANNFDGDIRSVGFIQKFGGRVVVGGQISFRFKRDRLFMIGSEALPHVALPPPVRTRMSHAAFRDGATAALRRELALPDAPVTAGGDEVVLPLVGDDAVLGYRIAVPVTIDGGADGRYLAYSDPATGALLAVRQMNMYASGTVLYRSFARFPGQARIDRPAPHAHLMLNGAMQTTTAGGQLSWSDAAPQSVTTSVNGELVVVMNRAVNGRAASALLSLSDGGHVLWDASGASEDDAQVQTYLSVNIAKDFARALDAEMPTLDDPLTANVNLAQNCNAFFDGKSVNFFHASDDCQNTGLVQDVVFHEYGHAVHAAEIITGVGAFDGAMSEGAADFFAAQITGDPAMGRGFFYSDAPLRNLDPPASENRWPQDIGEVHKTGLIFGGTFWDLRKALIAQLGEAEGIRVTKKVFVGALRRSVSIPTSLLEALASDDDDGDLANGTPHECAIRDAYGRHGLRTATGVAIAPGQISQPTLATTVHINLIGLAERCVGDEVVSAELNWKPAGPGGPPAGKAPAVQASATQFYAQLPLAADSKVLYQVKVEFRDRTTLTLPDNLADPYYELYAGRVVPLYCTSFEDGDPMAAGWTTGTKDGTPSPWAWGVPRAGSTDPHAAFSGTHVIAQVLDGDYAAKSSSYLRMPPVEIGQWSDVRLQYRRWLDVEDSHFDQARIMVGDHQAWVNFTQNAGESSSAQHIDREWRFHDVPLSGYETGHTLQVSWDLSSDEGLEFGGWQIDDVCVVANVNGVCGDGVVTVHEACDDGPYNGDRANACRSWCQAPICGDSIIDDREDCDDGPTGSTACTDHCNAIGPPDLGGCCSAHRGAGGSCLLAGLTLALVLRRRRRYC